MLGMGRNAEKKYLTGPEYAALIRGEDIIVDDSKAWNVDQVRSLIKSVKEDFLATFDIRSVDRSNYVQKWQQLMNYQVRFIMSPDNTYITRDLDLWAKYLLIVSFFHSLLVGFGDTFFSEIVKDTISEIQSNIDNIMRVDEEERQRKSDNLILNGQRRIDRGLLREKEAVDEKEAENRVSEMKKEVGEAVASEVKRILEGLQDGENAGGWNGEGRLIPVGNGQYRVVETGGGDLLIYPIGGGQFKIRKWFNP